VSLWTYSLRDKKIAPFGDVHSSTHTNSVFSPDGRWVAYVRSERNRAMVYVEPFPATGARYQLPVEASGIAHHPLWSPDGKELFFNPAPGLFSWVSITTEPTVTFGNPKVGPRPFVTGPPIMRRAFDIRRDGKFVGLIEAGQTVGSTIIPHQIQVVLNWFEEVKGLVPATQ
jgi:dipeptidyl aminopeptidase/acylaminoacyl peptidase